jgi:hypothetical protein
MAQAQARQRALEDDPDGLVGLGDKGAVPSVDGAVYYPFPQPMVRKRGDT